MPSTLHTHQISQSAPHRHKASLRGSKQRLMCLIKAMWQANAQKDLALIAARRIPISSRPSHLHSPHQKQSCQDDSIWLSPTHIKQSLVYMFQSRQKVSCRENVCVKVSERHTRGNSSLIIIESPPSHAHNIMTKALLHRACMKLTGDV